MTRQDENVPGVFCVKTQHFKGGKNKNKKWRKKRRRL